MKNNILQKKELRVLCTLVLVVVATAILTSYTAINHNSFARATLVQELAPFVPDAKLQQVSVWELRLMRFSKQMTYDPILALPATNTSELLKAIRALEESQQAYISFYSPQEQGYIENALHPFEFLYLLPALEDARREVLNNPTYVGAVQYVHLLDIALREQQAYIQRLVDTFPEFEQRGFSSSFLAGTTSDSHIVKTLNDLQLHLESQRKKVVARKRCLLGWRTGNKCPMEFPALVPISSDALPENREKVLTYGDVLRNYIHENRERFSLTTTPANELPLVHITNAACTRNSNSVYIFTWRSSLLSEHIALWATPITELIFHDTQQQKNAFETKLANAGVEYEFQPINPYYCIDNGFDTGLIRSAYYIQNSLQKNPLFKTETLQSEYSHIAELEESLTSQTTILHTATVEAYIAALQTLLYSQQRYDSLHTNDIARAHELVTIWRAQSAWLESEIIRLESMAATSRYVLTKMEIPIEPLFVTRSYFSNLLFANNTTLFEPRVSFLFEIKPLNLTEAGVVEYFTDLQQHVPLSTLVDFIRTQEDLAFKIYLR